MVVMNKRVSTLAGLLLVLLTLGIGFLLNPENGGSEIVNSSPSPAADLQCTTDGVCVPRATSTIPLARPTSTVEANATVVRVVDGDTFIAKLDAEPGEFTIRMLGVNTPETVDPRKPVECFGKQASDHLKAQIDGKRVRLEGDPKADERDKYGRLLRNVYLEDGTDINAGLVRDGYAYAYLSFPLTPARKQELKTLQEIARALSSGVWSPNVCPATS